MANKLDFTKIENRANSIEKLLYSPEIVNRALGSQMMPVRNFLNLLYDEKEFKEAIKYYNFVLEMIKLCNKYDIDMKITRYELAPFYLGVSAIENKKKIQEEENVKN